MHLTDNLLAMLRSYDTLDEAMKDAIIEEEHLRGTPLANVYVIEGSSGSHSSTTTWYVSAFLLEEDARKELEMLQKWCRESLKNDYFDIEILEKCPDKQAKKNYVYGGLTYRVFTVPLRTNE